MPKVLPLGVSYDDFWKLNPHKINILILAYNEKSKAEIRQQNMLMHLQGMYFVDALLATVGNMFKGKGQKTFNYPTEPYKFDFDNDKGIDVEDGEQREVEIKRRNFVTQLNNLFRDIDHTLQERDDGH